MIRVSYSGTISSLIFPGVINTGAIHSGATVRMSLRNVGYLDQSSFLCGGYENLFIDSEYPVSQSLMLHPGRYLVNCMAGTITVAFYDLVAGPFYPARLVIEEETEVFFIFSEDCDNPSLYESEFILPYTPGLARQNIVEIPVGALNGRLSISLSCVGLNRTGWFESVYFVDTDRVYASFDDLVLGTYYGPALSSVELLQVIDMSTIVKSTVASYYTDENNYLALYILPNYATMMYGKVAGVEVRHILEPLNSQTAVMSFVIIGTTVTINMQGTQFMIEVPGILVPFETVYIGYDGVGSYLNNRITGISL